MESSQNEFLGWFTIRACETYPDVSTPNVALIELAPDPQRNTTQIAPNGKRVAPLSWPMSPLRSGTDDLFKESVVTSAKATAVSCISDPRVKVERRKSSSDIPQRWRTWEPVGCELLRGASGVTSKLWRTAAREPSESHWRLHSPACLH